MRLRLRALRASRPVRSVTLALAAIAVILAAGIATSLTVDLGPALRRRAEVEGSTRVHRPMHIGRLSVGLLQGRFVLEDFVIEGLTPTDRPFLRAKRIEISTPWSTLLRKELLFDSIVMTDWQMVVETWPNGRHSFPKLTPDGPSGPKRFTTTLQYVRAMRGQFTFEDHGMPWSTVARNLDVTVTKVLDYRGRASFSGGTVTIQKYVPMWADMQSTFTIEGGKMHFDRIDLRTDGARSLLTGDVDLAHWPEQIYQVNSRVEFPRMRELFFANDRFSLFGEGDFAGTFHLYKGGRELKGSFTSDLAGVNDYRFPALRGRLLWLPDRFEVTDASSRFYGGRAKFTYSMAPLGKPTRPLARFDATYEDVDLAAFTDFLDTKGIRLAGRASGRHLLEWPLGRFSAHRGDGQMSVQPPSGARVLGRLAPSDLISEEERLGSEWGPFNPHPLLGHVPIGGELTYRFDPEWVEIAPSRVATPRSYVEFQGRTAYGERSRIPFHVTSADWQESDRILAGVITAFGSPTSAVSIGGHGEFDGVMLDAFRDPRIEGTFVGERMRAWDVMWGSGRAKIVVEDSYLDVTDGILRHAGSEIRANGRFSLGYPRKDRGEEINARIQIVNRPVVDLRHAFELDDYPVEGTISGEHHLIGKYETPFGFGRMTIAPGVAYGEPFESATASLRFEGNGVRFDAVDIAKGAGAITGAAFLGWNGTYSFNADGRRIPMERVAAAAYPQAPLSGLMDFSASGSGTFDVPRYDVRIRIRDLFVRDEGIGEVTGRIAVRGKVLTLETEAASPRLSVSGAGRIALTPQADAELSFRFTESSLDPYVRTFQPALSPFTTAVASGTIRVVGELRDIDHVLVDGTVEQLDLRLFDYKLQNAGPIRLALDQHTVRIDRMRLVGEETQLDLSGAVGLHDQRISLQARGDANLGILQGFFRDIRSAGRAELVGAIQGPLRAPVVSGSAVISDGRIRHFSLPHSLEAVNGRVTFDAGGIRLEGVTARLGGGDVRFGGRIALKGYKLGELDVTAAGENMRLRYPEGIRSIVNADLALRGDFWSPTLGGSVLVLSAVWSRSFDAGGGLFEFSGTGASGAPPPAETTIPVRFDIRLVAPSSLRIENNAARIVSSADLNLRGTYDRPLLFGRAEVERGEVRFEGKRYLVTRGTIDFTNPTRIEPFFDVEAETRVRVPGQTYRVVLAAAGTPQRFNYELTSDPPLPPVDILSLLLSDVSPTRDAELRAFQSPNASEERLIRERATRALVGAVSQEVGKLAEQAFGLEVFQLTPMLADPNQQSSRLNPSARLTIGKRISDRVYLTYARSLSSSTRDQIILLEYDQSDRLSWILSQNEDRTYALDMRVRHIF